MQHVPTYPIHLVEPFRPSDEPRALPFWARWLIYAGVFMSQPAEPKGWGWNPSVLTLCLVVASLIAGGSYYLGHQAAIIENLQQKQVETQSVAGDAINKSLYAISKVDGGDGHAQPAKTPSGVPPKEKKPSQGE